MADLRSLWPVGGASGEFLTSTTRSFFRRLSGSGSSQRSQSMPHASRPTSFHSEVSQSAKASSVVAAQQLSELRHEIESNTERLNDGNFEVTEEWLFEFANQHAQYMEKATSNMGAGHEFRSTQDLFQHVLQHPRVLKLIGDWKPGEAAAGGKDSSSSDAAAWSPGSTVMPSSTDCSPEHEVDVKGSHASPDAKPSAAADEPKDEAKDFAKAPHARTGGYSKEGGKIAARGLGSIHTKPSGQQRSHSLTQASAVRHRASWPAPPSAESELMQKFRQQRGSRASFPGRSTPVGIESSDGGELARKMRQRANSTSWQGSPQKRRLAGRAKTSNDISAETSGAKNLAERRKLLEDKLASCGFHKAAPAGGA